MRLLPFRLSGPVKLLLAVVFFTVLVVVLFSVFMFAPSSSKSVYYTREDVIKVTSERPLTLMSTLLTASSQETISSSDTIQLVINHSNLSSSSSLSSLSSTMYLPTTIQDIALVESNLSLPRWPTGSFCDEFLSDNFPLHSTICTTGRVQCSGTPHDNKMGSCVMKRVGIDIEAFHTIMKNKRDSVESSNTLWLLHDKDLSHPCGRYDFQVLEKYMNGGDYVKRLAKTSILSLPQKECQEWVNGTTFMFIGFDVHIYFKFLSWFSLYNGIVNNRLFTTHESPKLIIRIPETKFSFLFPEFERKLFPETNVMGLEDLAKSKVGTLCFERIVTTPWAFSSNPFRCKMADAIVRLRKNCYKCNSRGLPGTRFLMFRKRVLNACSLKDEESYTGKTPRRIVVLLRKPYSRFHGDEPTKISRILVNSGELVNAVKSAFPSTNVTTMHGEELALCDQISLIHKADILLGVHGAGLVHLWWLQDHALLFELVPRSQLSNPTFKMLSTLTGRRYYSYTNVKGGDKKVTVDVNDVINRLKLEY